MAHRFSLILNREVTDLETVTLKEATGADLSFVGDTLPTNAEVAVTRIEFEDDIAPTLAEAIESGFSVVKTIPELSIPGLSVPAQPADADGGGEDEGSTKETAEAAS
jgi:hypothetical protein